MIRKESPADLFLIRHAEAYKNLSGVHGGGDQRLTPKGINQARLLGNFISNQLNFGDELKLVHQPEERSRNTAINIGLVAIQDIVEVKELKGVSLGVAGGLTAKELLEKYPEVAEALSAWRENKGDLSARPRVPGSEPMEEFAGRICGGLQTSLELCESGQNLGIVGTTSTLNMLNHLLINDGVFDRDHYDFISYPLGSVSSWKVSINPPVQTATIYSPLRVNES